MKHMITPCLWFNNEGRQAAELYGSAFQDVRVSSESPMVTELELSGQKFILLDGGPQFQPNPSISFFYICETEREVEQAWNSLTNGGKVLMPLDKYPWSDKYGWVSDKFGISWQIALGRVSEVGQKITPSLLFTGDQFGSAEEAIPFYTSVFKDSSVDGVLRYEDHEGKELGGKIKHAQVVLDGSKMMLMESLGHDFTFSEGVSLTVYCSSQEDIDYYWKSLTAEGGKESMCGWLSDRFGVWWQVIPDILGPIMSDPEKAGKAAKAFMSMKKMDIKQIQRAILA